MNILRLLVEILDGDARRRLLYLVPVMLLASAADIAVVGAGASFASMIVNPDGMGASRIGQIATSLLGADDDSLLLTVGGLTLLVTLCGNVASLVSLRLMNVYGQEQAALLSARLLESYLSRPYSFFLVRDPSGLATRVLREAQGVIASVLMGLLGVAARLVGAVVIIGALTIYDPALSILLVVVLGTVYVGSYAILRRLYRRIGRDRIRLQKECHHITTESLEGVKEIQIYGLAHDTGQRYREVVLELARLTALFNTLASSMRYLIETMGVGAVVLVAVYYQWTGREVLELVPIAGAYLIASVRLLPIFQLLFMAASKAQLQLAALEGVNADVMDGLDYPLLVDREPMAFEEALVLDQASFTYPSVERPVFAHLDLSIKRGEWIAFVGATGAGKSTLVDMLLGLLSPDEGEMRVDDAVIDPDQAKSWQRGVAYVPQHIFIRAASLRENISFSSEVCDADIQRAAEIANLGDFIENGLEQGYDTQLGARGMRLSGGQRQRVGIARAIARKPSFLVLDEATSALDNETEAAVVAALRQELPGTTVVMIAHRLSSTRHCDRILVLEQGVIVEEGNYETLSAQAGRFSMMLAAGEHLGERSLDQM